MLSRRVAVATAALVGLAGAGCMSWRAKTPASPPRLASLATADLASGTDSSCALAAFAVLVQPDGRIAPGAVHLVSLQPADADPLQVVRLQQLLSQSSWVPGQDLAGHAMSGWVEIVMDCRGSTAETSRDGESPLSPGRLRPMEALLHDSRAARLGAARLLAAGEAKGVDLDALAWSLDAVRTTLDAFQRRRPFVFDDIRGGTLPASLRAAAADLWIVRRADSDHEGVFVFFDLHHRFLGQCAYLLGE